MRKTPKAFVLSLAAIALCLGSVSCSAPDSGPVETNTQEQLTKRTAAEAKTTLDDFFKNVTSETASILKDPSAPPEINKSATADEIAAVNLKRVKTGYPTSYGYLNENALGTSGAVSLIAFYANPAATIPGTVVESSESAFRLDGNIATIRGNDLRVKSGDGKDSDFVPGDITMVFMDGRWLISDFSTESTAVKASS
jgi:hypothetical protein